MVKYLLWTFALAYLIQIGVAALYRTGNEIIGEPFISGMMFIPTLGVLLSGGDLFGLGWHPHIRKNVKYILIAWFSPAVLTAIGAALYFWIFPGHLDLTGAALAAGAGAEALEAQGVSYPKFVGNAVIGSLTYAPLFDMLFGLGGEIGWRGFLYPQLKARFGRRMGWLLGGLIWGVWHWPLIWLIGHEYGTAYVGFPVVGMLVFCVFTVVLDILCDWLYEQSGSIWIPSLFHGAVNAASAVPALICRPDTGNACLLGPMPNGLLAGLPFLIPALLLFVLHGKEHEDADSAAQDALIMQEAPSAQPSSYRKD